MLTKDQKIIQFNEILDVLKRSKLVVVTDYRGVNVASLSQLRKQVRGVDAQAKVYKNTLARRAFTELGIDIPKEFLIGPSMMLSTEDDVVGFSKAIVDFAKESEIFQIKGGVLDDAPVSIETVEELAKLPSREELIAKSVSLIKSPLTALVGNLGSPLRGLVFVVKAIQTKKQEVNND